MAFREVSRMEIKEIIRRWQAGESPGRIAFGTGLSRNTVRKYLAATETQGIARDGARLPMMSSWSGWLGSAGQDRGRRRRHGRTSWRRGRTRSTSGSPTTGCR